MQQVAKMAPVKSVSSLTAQICGGSALWAMLSSQPCRVPAQSQVE